MPYRRHLPRVGAGPVLSHSCTDKGHSSLCMDKLLQDWKRSEHRNSFPQCTESHLFPWVGGFGSWDGWAGWKKNGFIILQNPLRFILLKKSLSAEASTAFPCLRGEQVWAARMLWAKPPTSYAHRRADLVLQAQRSLHQFLASDLDAGDYTCPDCHGIYLSRYAELPSQETWWLISLGRDRSDYSSPWLGREGAGEMARGQTKRNVAVASTSPRI